MRLTSAVVQSACRRRLCSTSTQVSEHRFSFADFVALLGVSTAVTFGIFALEKRYPETVVAAGSTEASDSKLVRTQSGPMSETRIKLAGSE